MPSDRNQPQRRFCLPRRKPKAKRKPTLEQIWEKRARHLASAKALLVRIIEAVDDGKAHRFSITVVDNTDNGSPYITFYFTGTLKAAAVKAAQELTRIHKHHDPKPIPSHSITVLLLPAKGQRVALPAKMYEKYLPRKRLDPADFRD